MARNVVVTGGGTGIGRAVAAAFAADGNTDLDRSAAADLESLAANWRANLDANLISAVLFRDALTDQRREALIAATSTGRPGAPDDIAGTVHFLASPAARQITGQVIAVNGGACTTR